MSSALKGRTNRANRAFLVAPTVKILPAMQETRVQSLDQEDPLEEDMATHSSIPAWRIPMPTPVFLPGESHGQRTLVGYSPWDHKE